MKITFPFIDTPNLLQTHTFQSKTLTFDSGFSSYIGDSPFMHSAVPILSLDHNLDMDSHNCHDISTSSPHSLSPVLHNASNLSSMLSQPPVDSQSHVSSKTTLPLKVSHRQKSAPSWIKDYYFSPPPSNVVKSKFHTSNYVTYDAFAPVHQYFLSNIALIKEPSTYNQAKKDPNWQEAMRKEITALEDNQTWTVTTPPLARFLLAANGFIK